MIFATGPQRSHSSTRARGPPRHPRRAPSANYLNELSGSGRLPLVLDKKRWRVAPDARLEMPPVRSCSRRRPAVYLAARLLWRHSDESEPRRRLQRRQLAAVVPSDLAPSCRTSRPASAAAEAGPFGEVFAPSRTLGAAPRDRRHLPRLRPQDSRTCRFRTHLLEPSVHGLLALRAVGHADPPGELRVFKLERGRQGRAHRHAVRAGCRPRSCSPASSGAGTSGSPTPTPSRSGSASRRSRALGAGSALHASQRLEDIAGGGVDMRLAVASTIEARPVDPRLGRRLRGPRPPALRDEVARQLRHAASRYEAGRAS